MEMVVWCWSGSLGNYHSQKRYSHHGMLRCCMLPSKESPKAVTTSVAFVTDFALTRTVPHLLSIQKAWPELPVISLIIICVLSKFHHMVMNFKFQRTCCNKHIDLHKQVLVTQLQDLNYCVVMMNLSYGGKLCVVFWYQKEWKLPMTNRESTAES